MKDKELRMKVLEQLMDAMDEKNVDRLRPKKDEDEDEDMAVIEEKQVVPASEVGDVLRKKLGKALESDDDSDSSSDSMGGMDEDCEEEDDYGSRLMRKINQAKAARKSK